MPVWCQWNGSGKPTALLRLLVRNGNTAHNSNTERTSTYVFPSGCRCALGIHIEPSDSVLRLLTVNPRSAQSAAALLFLFLVVVSPNPTFSSVPGTDARNPKFRPSLQINSLAPLYASASIRHVISFLGTKTKITSSPSSSPAVVVPADHFRVWVPSRWSPCPASTLRSASQ